MKRLAQLLVLTDIRGLRSLDLPSIVSFKKKDTDQNLVSNINTNENKMKILIKKEHRLTTWDWIKVGIIYY